LRAIRIHQFGGTDVLRFEEVPDPRPAPGQVLVRTRAIGVNPVDTYIRSGIYGARQFPLILGSDAAGVVEAVGPAVEGSGAPTAQSGRSWHVGDRVYTARSITGTYAELVLCEAGQVRPLPENLSHAQGAGVYVPYGTAYRAMFIRTRARAGETVLVHGASGGVGTACVQFGRAAGLTVIGTAGTEKGLALVREQGAHHAVDHTRAGYLEEIKALTGGRGPDLIVEMLTNVNLDRDLGLLAFGGRVIVVGNRGRVEVDARQTMTKELSVIGMSLNNVTPAELTEIHAALAAGFESGTLNPVVGRELPLAEAARAHELVMQPGAFGKIVLVP
jgi:NADPH2:quinone reductase